jgi:hypothetical protein
MCHGNTETYDDWHSVKKGTWGGDYPIALTSIRVWTGQQNIIGFEAFYDGLSAGARMGDGSQVREYETFILNPEEGIVEVFGCADEIIHTLGFRTSEGREISYG